MIRTSIFSASLLIVALGGCDDEQTGTGGGGGASSTTSASSAEATGNGGDGAGGEDVATTSATGGGGEDASTTTAGGEGSTGSGEGGAGGEGGSSGGEGGSGGVGEGGEGGEGGGDGAEPGSYEALVEGDGAILHFPFEEAAPPFASVASSHEATCDGCTPHVSTLDALGHGVEIGSANQTIAVSPGIELTDLAGVTFEVWITPKAMDEATVLEWVAPDGELYAIFVDRWQDGLRAHWQAPNGSAGAVFCGDAEACLDHTFAIVGVAEYGASSYAHWLFIDGDFEGGVSAEGSSPYEPGPGLGTLRLGSDVDGGGSFTGVIDEVAIYPKALDDAQIAEHFDAGIE